MPIKSPPNCRFYFEDYHRGREVSECRLPKSRDSLQWERSICDACPVPELLRETNCAYLALEGTIRKKVFGQRIEIFSVCTKHLIQLPDGKTCNQCQAEQDDLLKG